MKKLLAAALLLGSMCHAAPAPLPKRPSRAGVDVTGPWILRIGNYDWAVRLHPGGRYSVTNYYGSWSVRGGTLRVTEYAYGGAQTYRWAVDVRTLTGRSDAGAEVSIRRPGPGDDVPAFD